MKTVTVKFSYQGKKYNLKARLDNRLSLRVIKANANVDDEDYGDEWCLTWELEEGGEPLLAEVIFYMNDNERTTDYPRPAVNIWGEVLHDVIKAEISWKQS